MSRTLPFAVALLLACSQAFASAPPIPPPAPSSGSSLTIAAHSVAANTTGSTATPTGVTTLPSSLSVPLIEASVSASVSAAGTTQGTATVLTADINYITTCGSGAGVELEVPVAGYKEVVVNKGSNACKVYPSSSVAIDALASNTAMSVPVNAWVEYDADSTTQWSSTANNISAMSLFGGSTGGLPYQSAANTTSFLAAGTSSQVLIGGASLPAWQSLSSWAPSIGATTVTSLTNTGATTLSSGQVVAWNADVGISRGAAQSLYIGNGTAGSATGNLYAYTMITGVAGSQANFLGPVGLTALSSSTIGFSSSSSNATAGTFDTGIARSAVGVLEVTTSYTPNASGALALTSLEMKGSTPTGSGTCSINTQTGGNQGGTFKLNGACSAGGTVILTFATTQGTGYNCWAGDRTTVADLFPATASSTTTCTLTATSGGATGDVIQFNAFGN